MQPETTFITHVLIVICGLAAFIAFMMIQAAVTNAERHREIRMRLNALENQIANLEINDDDPDPGDHIPADRAAPKIIAITTRMAA